MAAERLLMDERDFEAKAEIRRTTLGTAACQRKFSLHYILLQSRAGHFTPPEAVLGRSQTLITLPWDWAYAYLKQRP
jgi:hypothetical protein